MQEGELGVEQAGSRRGVSVFLSTSAAPPASSAPGVEVPERGEIISSR
ncbi:hypothetical protein WMF04_22210 [Sorangium sp. So ce260]